MYRAFVQAELMRKLLVRDPRLVHDREEDRLALLVPQVDHDKALLVHGRLRMIEYLGEFAFSLEYDLIVGKKLAKMVLQRTPVHILLLRYFGYGHARVPLDEIEYFPCLRVFKGILKTAENSRKIMYYAISS